MVPLEVRALGHDCRTKMAITRIIRGIRAISERTEGVIERVRAISLPLRRRVARQPIAKARHLRDSRTSHSLSMLQVLVLPMQSLVEVGTIITLLATTQTRQQPPRSDSTKEVTQV